MTQPDRPATTAEAFRYNAAANRIDLDEAERRLDSLLERRAKLAERSTFGLLALNGTSATGAFAALQAGGTALGNLGISTAEVAFCISAFLFGSVLSVISVWAESIHLTTVAGKQFCRTSHLRRIESTLADHLQPEAIDRLGREIKELPKVTPNDFAYSPVQLILHNFSGGAWLAGIGLAIYNVGQGIAWFG